MSSGAFIVAVAGVMGAGPVEAPAPLLEALRGRTLSGHCLPSGWTAPAPLGSQAHVSLPDGRLVVFLQVPDDECVRSKSAVPVVVDPRGRFSWGTPVAGVVLRAAAGPDGALWAASVVEHDGPRLWTSPDGLQWSEVKLPPKRTTAGPDETFAALCPMEGGLCIELERELEHARIHALLWRDAAPPSGWGPTATCAPCRATEADVTVTWSREALEAEGHSAVVFRQGKLAVAFPSTLWRR